MKKYRVTSKHPAYKEGLTVGEDESGFFIRDENSESLRYEYSIYMSIKKGWIEEIKEPEFTRKDLESLLIFYNYHENMYFLNFDDKEYFEMIIKKWIRATKTF